MASYECAYCGKIDEATDDHIPPKNIYSRPLPPDLPSVKACEKCNHGASDDDEYFRDVVVRYQHISGLAVAQQQVGKMLRAMALPAKQKYAKRTIEALTQVEVRSEGGIIVGKAPAYKVDVVRLTRAVERYVRGLYRYELGKRVPQDLDAHLTANPDDVTSFQDEIVRTFRGAQRRVVQENIFWYSWLTFDDVPNAAAWLLVFFDHFPVLAILRPRPV